MSCPVCFPGLRILFKNGSTLTKRLLPEDQIFFFIVLTSIEMGGKRENDELLPMKVYRFENLPKTSVECLMKLHQLNCKIPYPDQTSLDLDHRYFRNFIKTLMYCIRLGPFPLWNGPRYLNQSWCNSAVRWVSLLKQP